MKVRVWGRKADYSLETDSQDFERLKEQLRNDLISRLNDPDTVRSVNLNRLLVRDSSDRGTSNAAPVAVLMAEQLFNESEAKAQGYRDSLLYSHLIKTLKAYRLAQLMQVGETKIPVDVTCFLSLFVSREVSQSMVGDLQERYPRVMANRGRWGAILWYCLQVTLCLRPIICAAIRRVSRWDRIMGRGKISSSSPITVRHVIMSVSCECGAQVDVYVSAEHTGFGYGGHAARCPECGHTLRSDFPDRVIRAQVVS